MSVKILSITLLLVSMCVSCHSSEGTHRHHPGPFPPCCPAVTKGNMTADVVGQIYHKLAARGHCVKAIIFNTKDGKQLCADPDAQWVKDLTAKMRKV
ncbi:eotaxin isoform X4 [Oreochromis niloticus]|uniref:eotaxin isoform X3 n=1 Tax=Oreochromis niloticus TaxID=8128 RepID=UPI0003944554|nr:eotaxin-like isoform X3 [Oreochromis niloticus]XP_025760125.1 eotaxin-like isoform X4 [Oreochromis niloticus]